MIWHTKTSEILLRLTLRICLHTRPFPPYRHSSSILQHFSSPKTQYIKKLLRNALLCCPRTPRTFYILRKRGNAEISLCSNNGFSVKACGEPYLRPTRWQWPFPASNMVTVLIGFFWSPYRLINELGCGWRGHHKLGYRLPGSVIVNMLARSPILSTNTRKALKGRTLNFVEIYSLTC